MTMLAASALFFGYVRLGVAYLPVVWILQAMAIDRLLQRVPVSGSVQRRAMAAAAAIGVVLMLNEARVSGNPRVLMLDGMVDESGDLVEDQALQIDQGPMMFNRSMKRRLPSRSTQMFASGHFPM